MIQGVCEILIFRKCEGEKGQKGCWRLERVPDRNIIGEDPKEDRLTTLKCGDRRNLGRGEIGKPVSPGWTVNLRGHESWESKGTLGRLNPVLTARLCLRSKASKPRFFNSGPLRKEFAGVGEPSGKGANRV